MKVILIFLLSAILASNAQLYSQLDGATLRILPNGFWPNTNGGTTFQIADDFDVPVGSIWNVEAIVVYQYYFPGALTPTNWTVSIFADGVDTQFNPAPGNTIATWTGVPQDGIASITPYMQFPVPVQLNAGRYWFSIYPTVNVVYFNASSPTLGWWAYLRNTTTTVRGNRYAIRDSTGFLWNNPALAGLWMVAARVDTGPDDGTLDELRFQVFGTAITIDTTGSVTTGQPITSGGITTSPQTTSPVTSASLTTETITSASLTSGIVATTAASAVSGLSTSTDSSGNVESSNSNENRGGSDNVVLIATLSSLMAIIVIMIVALAVLLFVWKNKKAKRASMKPRETTGDVPLKNVPPTVSKEPSQPSLAYSVTPALTSPYAQQPNFTPGNSASPIPPTGYNFPPATNNYSAIPSGASFGTQNSGSNNRNPYENLSVGSPSDKLPFEIDYKELIFEKEVGRGAYGVVYKGKWRGGTVAIKQLILKDVLNEKELKDFKAEASVMARLRPHVNVVQFLGITSAPAPLCIVTEFMDQGSLYSYLHSDAKIDTNVLMNLVKGIAAGMLHLHKEELIHRDLASRNILLGSGFQVKISDFGLSRSNSTSNETKSDTGPLKWMAPEAIKNRVYSKASDVWSFGVTLWEVVTRSDPYPQLDPVQAALDVTHGKVRLEIPPYCPPILDIIIQACFNESPGSRPTFVQITERLQNARLDEWTSTTFTPPRGDQEDFYARSPVSQTNQSNSGPVDNLNVSSNYKTFLPNS